MGFTVTRPNNQVPIGTEYLYLLVPGPPSNQWFRITRWNRMYVYYEGVYPHKMDGRFRTKQFDDHVHSWVLADPFLPLFLLTEDGLFLLGDEDGSALDWRL